MDLLQIGQTLSINFEKENNLVEMTAKIAEIYDDRVVIDLPSYFMRYIEYLDVGRRLTIKAFSKVGTVDFNAIVISSPLEEEFSVELDYNAMKMTPNEEIPAIKAVETLQITKGESFINAKTFEISTDYLKFYSDKSFELEENFNCVLILPKDYGTISFVGTITEIDEIYTNEYTISYSNLNEYDRQNLLYYMYIYSSDSD